MNSSLRCSRKHEGLIRVCTRQREIAILKGQLVLWWFSDCAFSEAKQTKQQTWAIEHRWKTGSGDFSRPRHATPAQGEVEVERLGLEEGRHEALQQLLVEHAVDTPAVNALAQQSAQSLPRDLPAIHGIDTGREKEPRTVRHAERYSTPEAHHNFEPRPTCLRTAFFHIDSATLV